MEDSGFFNATKEELPISILTMGDTGGGTEVVYYSAGPLRCHEGKWWFMCPGSHINPAFICQWIVFLTCDPQP